MGGLKPHSWLFEWVCHGASRWEVDAYTILRQTHCGWINKKTRKDGVILYILISPHDPCIDVHVSEQLVRNYGYSLGVNVITLIIPLLYTYIHVIIVYVLICIHLYTTCTYIYIYTRIHM